MRKSELEDVIACERLLPLLKRLSKEDKVRRRYDKELKKEGIA